PSGHRSKGRAGRPGTGASLRPSNQRPRKQDRATAAGRRVRPRLRDTSRAARAARSSGDGLLAVGVVATVGGSVGLLGGVLRLLGGVGGLLGGIGKVVATGHVVACAANLTRDLRSGIGRRVGSIGRGLRRLRGSHVTGVGRVLRGLLRLGRRVGGFLGGVLGLVGVGAGAQAGGKGKRKKGLGGIHLGKISCSGTRCA